MAQDEKTQIWLTLANNAPVALKCPAGQEEAYHAAEKLLNTTWQRWMDAFGTHADPHEVLARVAFTFALNYQKAAATIDSAEQAMERLEQQLDELVVKL